jgi:hypothetical protein
MAICRTTDRLPENSPTHTPNVDEESRGRAPDRRFTRKLTSVCAIPASFIFSFKEATMMHPILNVGVDVAEDAVVVACAEHSSPVQRIANQRAPLRAWLKSPPAI